MKDSLPDRAARLFLKIHELDIEAALIFDMYNIRYFTGFTGSEGVLLVANGCMCLLVDGRYITQARLQASKAEVVLFEEKMPAVSQAIRDWGLGSIAVEANAISYQNYLELAESIPAVGIKPLGPEISRIRTIKDRSEIDLIRQAARISGAALDSLKNIIRPGTTEKELALELDYRMRRSGSEGVSFETIVASGENSALPHAHPGGRKLRNGDFIIFDYGSVCGGYHSDETCTFGIGEVPQKQVEVYNIVKEAHDRALSRVKHGVSCRLVDEAAREYIKERGFGAGFLHGTGHGVGLEVHEFPRISFLGDDKLESGMVITIEPGIYISGSFGVRIESLVLVSESGCEVLSQIDKKLNIIS